MAQVRIDDADDRRRRGVEALDHRGAEPQLAGAMYDAHWIFRGEIVRELSRSVRGVVVDDDELAVKTGSAVRREDRLRELGKPVTLVVGRRDQREREGRDGAGGQDF